ncbi:MAG: MBL fold metallo-hydrolase [Bacilli bacterium]|nr:MBL fold metallo-hydrolase [Bacilli bacterium]
MFISLFIGINIRTGVIVGVIALAIFLTYLFIKQSKKIVFIMLFTSLLGVGLSFIRPTFTKERYRLLVTEVKDNYYIGSSSFEKLYVYEKEHDHEIGDILLITGYKKELDFVTLESEFDFKNYLNSKGVYSELEIKKLEVKFKNPIRLHSFKQSFLQRFDENTQGIVGSILFGSGKESEINDLGRELHLARLISSSGVYLYFLYSLFRKLLGLAIKKEKIVDLISLFLFVPYLVFSFPKFIVIKFFVLAIFRYINDYFLKKKYSYIQIVSFSGILFLLLDYNLALQEGFILTYFIPILTFFINSSFRFKKEFIKSLFLTLLISLSFIPFSIKYYSEISLFSIPLFFLVSPIYLFIFLLSFLSLLGIPLQIFICNLVKVLNSSLKFISPALVKIYASPFDPISFLLFEIIFLLFIYYLSIRLRPMKNLTMSFLSFIFLLHVLPIKNMIRDYVSFINVGQGDSTLIKYKQYSILIDTGGNKYKDIAKEVLIPYFKKNQIYHIDMLITTHDDFDHSGAVPSLIENYTVKEYVKDYQKFPLNVGGLTLTNYNVYPELWSEENDESLVISFKINNYSYLIMGDAPKKIETAIMKDNEYIPCDILKVGHHGSKTSTSEAWIKYLHPTVGIISCGKNNFYGHPHNEVLAVLKKYKVKIRRTDIESTITF